MITMRLMMGIPVPSCALERISRITHFTVSVFVYMKTVRSYRR